MDPCFSCNSENPSYPCMRNFIKLTNETDDGTPPDYEQSFRSQQETEKGHKPKTCSSSPENACVFYKRKQHSKNNLSERNEIKHNHKRFLSEDALPNQPKLTRSTEKLKEFLLTHADFLDSLYEKTENTKEEQHYKETKELPAELWWVPPLKLPTSRSVPSVAMSNGYSAASSVGTHIKTRRSVEDLRQRVDSVCDLIEAMGIIEAEQNNLQLNLCTERSVGVSSIPPLKIPSASSQSSRGEDLKIHTSYKTVGSQCTVLDPKPDSDHKMTTGSATLRMHSSLPEYAPSSRANHAVRVASPQEESSSRYDCPHSSLSVSDLACIHIVNPMLSKLARLCTAQGQQYLTVLEELEKACSDFHNACKFQGATK